MSDQERGSSGLRDALAALAETVAEGAQKNGEHPTGWAMTLSAWWPKDGERCGWLPLQRVLDEVAALRAVPSGETSLIGEEREPDGIVITQAARDAFGELAMDWRMNAKNRLRDISELLERCAYDLMHFVDSEEVTVVPRIGDRLSPEPSIAEVVEACAQVCESRASSLMREKWPDGQAYRISEGNEAGKCASAIRYNWREHISRARAALTEAPSISGEGDL